LELYELMYSI